MPDVETTNWHAVKMLASAYGIRLRSWEEIQGQSGGKSMEAGQSTGRSDESGQTVVQTAEVEDLGAGTPFKITATRIEGGRTIYRFKWRGEAPPASRRAQPSSGEPLSSLPRSSSSGAVLTSPLKSEEGDASAENNLLASPISPTRSPGLLRKPAALKTLKASRSIPVLRSKTSNTFLRGSAAEPNLMTSLSPNGSPTRIAKDKGPAEEEQPGLLQSPFQPNAAGPSTSQAGRTKVETKPVGSLAGSVSMSRAESTPVEGAYGGRGAGRLQGGDVLGAILGWGGVGSPTGAARNLARPSTAEAVRKRSVSKGGGLYAPGAAIRESPNEKPSVPFEQAEHAAEPSTPAESMDASTSVGRSSKVSPFGHGFILPPLRPLTPPSAFVGAAASPQKSPRSDGRVRAPIPERLRLGDPFLPEVAQPEEYLRAQQAHQLREAQSFESCNSNTTARAADDRPPVIAFPPGLLPHLHRCDGKPDETLVFDVLQHYHQCDSDQDAVAKRFSAFPPSTRDSHRRSNSAGFVSSTQSGAPEDSFRHSATQAQATPASASPGDDPRFAIWAVRDSKQDGTLVLTGKDGSPGPTSSTVQSPTASMHVASPASTTSKRWSLRNSSAPADSVDASASGTSKGAGAAGSSAPSGAGRRSTSTTRDSILLPPGRPALIAATPSRLVAELTSEIDSRLLTDFFYTYRQYLHPQELLRLLILRFRWAMSEPSSAHDEAVRRIVRVRTYVVLKYWLLHFFEHDFLGDRVLRKQLTDWLNQLSSDPRLPGRPADMSIVKSLKKVVRNLKDTYSQAGVGGLLMNDAGRLPAERERSASDASSASVLNGQGGSSSTPSVAGQETRSAQSTSSAEQGAVAAASSVSSPVTSNSGGSEELHSPRTLDNVDLDFDDDSVRREHSEPGRSLRSGARQAAPKPSQPLTPARSRDGQDAARRANDKPIAGSATATDASGPASSNEREWDSSGMVKLRRGTANGGMSSQIAPPPLPHSHNALSRVFVNTVGRLSRFKRVLGQRSAMPSPFPNVGNELGFDDLEFEANDSGDLLFIRGGLENFISFFNLPAPAPRDVPPEEDANYQVSDSTAQDETPSLSAASAKSRSTPASSIDLTPDSHAEVEHDAVDLNPLGAGLGIQGADLGVGALSSTEPELLPLDKTALDAINLASLESLTQLPQDRAPAAEHLHHTTSEQTLRSTSTVERRSLSHSGARSRHSPRLSARYSARLSRSSVPNIVQIDDIDLSSDEDDGVVRRALRRLPGARDLRMANNVRDLEPIRQSFDTVSNASLGRVHAAHASMGNFGPVYAASTYAQSLAHLGRTDKIGIVHTEMLDPDEALAGYELVQGFRLDGMESDEDEPGDVEAALRRLEGVIDEEKQREKARRVEAMWQSSQERKAEEERRKAGLEADDDSQRDDGVPGDHDEDGDGDEADREDHDGEDDPDTSGEAPRPASIASVISISLISGPPATVQEEDEDSDDQSHRPAQTSRSQFDDQRSPPPAPLPVASPQRIQPQAGSVSQASSASQAGSVSRNRPLSHGSGSYGPSEAGSWAQAQAAYHARAMDRAIASSKFGLWNLPPVHRSFLLSYRSEVIAQQLCLIECELFHAVSWEELVSSRWKERRHAGEVLDWEAFYQARVREKAEAQQRGELYKERGVEAIIARFNLTCNWVASEIVLTQSLDERAAVVSKLIRIAWVRDHLCEREIDRGLGEMLTFLKTTCVPYRNATSSPILRRSRRSCSAFNHPGWSDCARPGRGSGCGRCVSCAISNRSLHPCAISVICATRCRPWSSMAGWRISSTRLDLRSCLARRAMLPPVRPTRPVREQRVMGTFRMVAFPSSVSVFFRWLRLRMWVTSCSQQSHGSLQVSTYLTSRSMTAFRATSTPHRRALLSKWTPRRARSPVSPSPRRSITWRPSRPGSSWSRW